MRRPRLLAAVLVLGAVVVAASPAPAVRLQQVELPRGEGLPQFVRATRDGGVYLLRAGTDRIGIRKIDAAGAKSVVEVPWSSAGLVLDAAVSPSGREWLVLSGADLYKIANRKAERLPPTGWEAQSVSWRGGEPVVGVLPRLLMSQRPAGFRPPAVPPLILELSGERWFPLVEEARAPRAGGGAHSAILERSTRLAPSGREQLWTSLQYAYRLARINASGRQTDRVVVELGRGAGDDELDGKARAEADAAFEARARTQGQVLEDRSAAAFTASIAVQDLAEGRDGRLYILLGPGAGSHKATLDRYDPASGKLERLPLDLDYGGRISIAAGTGGLFLAPFESDQPVSVISWERLGSAPWSVVEGHEGSGER